ncbi:MAG: hypothetical protein JWM59_3262 [Verrucomicrobiales bacterium]|nr:hypothetical protein [Verrucomicrobiales bacterium]
MPTPAWLILLYTLPASKAAARLSLWRQLKRLGAVSLKTSAYIMPQRPEHEESLQWLAQQIREHGGEASLLRSAEVDTISPHDVIDLFQAARSEDYLEILTAANALEATGRRKTTAASSDLAIEAGRLKKRFAGVRKIDFFDCPKASEVKEVLAGLLPVEKPPKQGFPANIAAYQGRLWQTRPKPELDRVASAWLIKRFIDPTATFVFSPERNAFQNAVTYDMLHADFGHEGDDCTFETLVRRFSVNAPGLDEAAQIVHAADLEDAKFARTEGLGLLAVLRGWATQELADNGILQRGFDLMDGLLSHLKSR